MHHVDGRGAGRGAEIDNAVVESLCALEGQNGAGAGDIGGAIQRQAVIDAQIGVGLGEAERARIADTQQLGRAAGADAQQAGRIGNGAALYGAVQAQLGQRAAAAEAEGSATVGERAGEADGAVTEGDIAELVAAHGAGELQRAASERDSPGVGPDRGIAPGVGWAADDGRGAAGDRDSAGIGKTGRADQQRVAVADGDAALIDEAAIAADGQRAASDGAGDGALIHQRVGQTNIRDRRLGVGIDRGVQAGLLHHQAVAERGGGCRAGGPGIGGAEFGNDAVAAERNGGVAQNVAALQQQRGTRAGDRGGAGRVGEQGGVAGEGDGTAGRGQVERALIADAHQHAGARAESEAAASVDNRAASDGACQSNRTEGGGRAQGERVAGIDVVAADFDGGVGQCEGAEFAQQRARERAAEIQRGVADSDGAGVGEAGAGNVQGGAAADADGALIEKSAGTGERQRAAGGGDGALVDHGVGERGGRHGATDGQHPVTAGLRHPVRGSQRQGGAVAGAERVAHTKGCHPAAGRAEGDGGVGECLAA